MTTTLDDFGAALARELQSANMTKEQLSAKTGIPVEMLNMHLAGHHRPHPDRIKRIEAALELDEGALAGLPLPPPPSRRPGRL